MSIDDPTYNVNKNMAVVSDPGDEVESIKTPEVKHEPREFRRLREKYGEIFTKLQKECITDLQQADESEYNAIILHYHLLWKKEVNNAKNNHRSITLKVEWFKEEMAKWRKNHEQKKLLNGPVNIEALKLIGMTPAPCKSNERAKFQSNEITVLIKQDGYVVVSLTHYDIPVAGGVAYSMTNLLHLMEGMGLKSFTPIRPRKYIGFSSIRMIGDLIRRVKRA